MTNKELLKQIIENNKAHQAVIKLYKNNFEESLILELISLGQLGEKNNKKTLTQKQSNTMYDKTISEFLVDSIKKYEIIKNIEIYNFKKYENDFLVILLPYNFSLEFMEKSQIFEDSDYLENDNKLKLSSPNTAGALYSVQLGILEMLDKRQKQARILIIRYMHLSSGIGSIKLREISREIIKNKNKELDNLNNLKKYIKNDFPLHFESYKKSKIIEEITKKKIDDYF